MSDLFLHLLGSFSASYGSRPLNKFRTIKVPALLIYLVSEPPIAHRREALMTLLWPDMPLESAQTNLRQIIYQLRKALPEVDTRQGDESVPLILSERQTVQLNPQAAVTADSVTFTNLMEAVKAHEHSDLSSCPLCQSRLEEAVALYQGSFLADFYLEDSSEFEEWAHRRREAYRRQVMDALAALAEGALRHGAYAEAQTYAQRQLDLDNLDERAYRQLMEALARSARRHEALAVYDEAARLLREELGMSPAAQTTRLAQQIENDSLETIEPQRQAVRGYKLLDEIGAGAFGVVHRAYQPVVGREVVIKIIRPRYANHPDFIRRFEAEAQTIARLEHPYIVPLYDYWREPDNAYLVMRWLRGGNLEERLLDGPLAPALAAGVVDQVAAALYAAHRRHIIHRDVKAANILLDEDNNAYLSDFSVAKDMLIDEEPFGLGGSVKYISPEQLLKEELSPQTDQYSLGIVIYQMLTGALPFMPDAPADILRRTILTESLPLVSSNVPGIPGSIDDVLQQATAKKPGDRFPDMIALARAFHSAVGMTGTVTAAVEEGPAAVEAEAALILNPYKGLRAFQESDSGIFFGREALVERLVDRLAEVGGATRFLAVVGPSGGGKSSVVKAGLLPALRGGVISGSKNWFVTEMTPGRDPLQELEVALMRVAVDPPSSLLEPLQHDEHGLANVLERILPLDEDGQTPQLLLLIDQFEELFTLTADEAARDHFIDSLLVALNEPHSRLRAVVTLRADFYDRPLQVAGLGELLRQRTEVLLPLTPAELELAITRPAALAGAALEPGLLAGITADVSDQPGTLPLMQYALTELFERRDNGVMTIAAYQEIGGVTAALGRRADEIYESLDPVQKEAARQMFLRLVTLGEGAEDTRRRVLREELESISDQPAADNEQSTVNNQQSTVNNPQLTIPNSQFSINNLQTVIDLFGQYRLLTFDRDPATRGPTVEVAHEALLREWSRLRQWLDESRADVRLQRLLAVETAAWQAAGQDDGYLLRGARMDQYDGWPETTTVSLTDDEKSFLAASFAAREARLAEEEARIRRELQTAQQLAETEKKRAEDQAKSARRLRLLAVGLAALLVAAVAAAGFALNRQQVAQQRFRESERMRLASQAQNALDRGEEGDLSALLAMQSLAQGYSPDADLALTRSLRQGFARQQFLGHTDIASSVDISPDGNRLMTSSLDGSVRIWDMQSGEEEMLLHQSETPLDLAYYSPDGRYAYASGHDGQTRLWSLPRGDLLGTFAGGTVGADSFGIALTADNQTLLMSDENIVRIWDVASGQEIGQLAGHEGAIWGVDITPDGRLAATGSADNTARLWDLSSGETTHILQGHEDSIGTLTFSADGRLLATPSGDNTARIWDTATGLEVRRLVGHDDQVFEARFSPDGHSVATASIDQTVRLWDIANGQEIGQFVHPADVYGVAFSPDGRFLATAATDHAARLWDLEAVSEPHTLDLSFAGGHPIQERARVLAPALGIMAAGRADGSIPVWETGSGRSLAHLNADGASVEGIALSADGQRILTANADGIARLWDVTEGTELQAFSGHSGPLWHVLFLENESVAVTAGDDGSIRLWDTNSGAQVKQLMGHDGAVRAVAISDDGALLLSGGSDGTARVWDVASGAEVGSIAGHDTAVLAVAFSPDGSQALTGGADNTARLWAVESASSTSLSVGEPVEPSEPLQTFVGHTGRVTQVAVSPDGQYVLTGSADQTARLWDPATGAEIRRYGDHLSELFDVGFTQQGDSVYTVDRASATVWRTTVEDVIAYACAQIPRALNDKERELFSINDPAPICDGVDAAEAAAGPVAAPGAVDQDAPASNPLTYQMEFATEAINVVQMGVPIQDAFIDAGNGQVVRPTILDAETLAMPVYRAAEEVALDFFEEPFDTGPYPKGEPLGMTLGDYVGVVGYGTYTPDGEMATVALNFEHLVPGGTYTLWCNIFNFVELSMIEAPCVSPTGVYYGFVAGEDGRGQITMQLNTFPPSTDDAMYEIAVAYHSDGLTYGPNIGKHGYNAHGIMWYDFMPPGS